MRSKEEKQRRNKGKKKKKKPSESASYQKQHLLFTQKGSTAAPKTNYSGRRGKAWCTMWREK